MVDYTVTPEPPTVLDQLRAIRDFACEKDEELRRDGATEIECVASLSMTMLDVLIVHLEDQQQALRTAHRVITVQCRSYWLTLLALVLSLLAYVLRAIG
jgi:hypothetical protein